MRIVVMNDKMVEVTRKGMSVVTHAYRQGGKIVLATYHECGKVTFQYTTNRPGEWLVLKGAGEFHWHKPGISILRDEAYKNGYMPYKTLKTQKRCLKDILYHEVYNLTDYMPGDLFKKDVYVHFDSIFQNTYLKYEDGRCRDVNQSLTPGEYILECPAPDSLGQMTHNPLCARYPFIQRRLLVVQ